MAKPKETPLFVEPEFDEAEYLETEKERAKAIMLIFFLGALSGMLAGYLQLQNYTILSILVMLAFLVLLTKILGIFRIRVSQRTSHRILNYGTYVLTWLLFWIIFLNPPLHTISSPQMYAPQVNESGTWVTLTSPSANVYSAYTGSNQYSIHLSYKYTVSVTGSSSFTFVPIGSSAAPSALSYTYSNGYLNFSQSVPTPGTEYVYTIIWSSANTGAQQTPLSFSMVFNPKP